MRYMGGKFRLAKKIAAIMQPDRMLPGGDLRPYVEPFCGACNVLAAMPGGTRLANDANKYIVATMKAAAAGWVGPDDVTEAEYHAMKDAVKAGELVDEALAGFIGFGCSFGGTWFGTFARQTTKQHYATCARNSLAKKMNGLQGVTWSVGSYTDIAVPPGSLIYCDPPYAATTEYKGFTGFDSDTFWQWCRDRASEGRIVYISEYSAPPDIECVAEFAHKTVLQTKKNADGSRQQQRIERLYRLGA